MLVVDDDPDIKMFFVSRLGKFGVETLYASDATQACRIASKEKPSAIIADNFMPDGDAYFLLHRLRASPETAYIPLLVISASKLSELTEQSLKLEIGGRPGAVQVFRKSFDTRELFETLQKYCCFEKTSAA